MVLSINLMEKECGMEIKFMSHESQRQYSLDFSEKFNIYCILKRITSYTK